MVLGQEVMAIHHVGSTAIPNISAKPIIDILVEVHDIGKIDEFNGEMIKLGYQPKGEFGISGRRFFIKGDDSTRTHHVHIFQTGDPKVERHLNFRDYMIAHPKAAQAYSRLKEKLAQKFPKDIEGYIEGKDGFIKEMDKRAAVWKKSQVGDDSMGRVTLRLREPTTIPIEADSICPDHFAGYSRAEIEALPAYYGRRKVTLGDLFTVEGEHSDNIIVEGDRSAERSRQSLCHVKRIGQGMSRGRITIHGDAGMHLGAEMCGGEILVNGDVDGWAGAQMSGGLIRVRGNAGPLLGGAYPGEKRGMRGGVIIVEGDAGPRAGERMRRGLIAIQGSVGEFAGVRMIAGSIFVFGALGARAGAGMKRGTIVALGGLADGLLLTFCYACSYRPSFLRYYLCRLREWGLPVTPEQIEGIFRRYSGDITTLGKGEILVHDQCE